MDEFEFRKIVYNYMKEICHYSQMQVFATSPYQKNYFQLQIDDAINALINYFQAYCERSAIESQSYTIHRQEEMPQGEQEEQQYVQNQQNQQDPQNQQTRQEGEDRQEEEHRQNPENRNTAVTEVSLRSFTREELAACNGSNGQPAYVAVNGIVYDVSNLFVWAGGSHFGVHAGRDLSNAFMGCHNQVTQMLDNIPQVGTLET